MATEELGPLQKTNGLVLVLVGLIAVIGTVAVFHPQRPSPFAGGSGFGTGYGTESIMIGASPRLHAAPR
jgi:uncharacterized membrane protein